MVGSHTYCQQEAMYGRHRPEVVPEAAKIPPTNKGKLEARTPLLAVEQHHVFKIAQLRKVVPGEDVEHLDHIDSVLRWQKERIRELEMQSPQTLWGNSNGHAHDPAQMEAYGSKIAELENQVSYYSQRCAALETILHDEGHQLPAAAQADANNAERALKDQGAVISQLQDAVQTLTSQLHAVTDRNSSYSAQLATATAANSNFQKENEQLSQKLEQAIHMHTARSEHYAQRLLDAADENNSLNSDLAQTKQQFNVREDVIQRMECEVQALRRGRSADSARIDRTVPESPGGSHRGRSNPGTPRAQYRTIAATASMRQQEQPSSIPGTPRLVQRSPPLTGSIGSPKFGATPAQPAAMSPNGTNGVAAPVMIWAPEQRGAVVGRHGGLGTSMPLTPGQVR